MGDLGEVAGAPAEIPGDRGETPGDLAEKPGDRGEIPGDLAEVPGDLGEVAGDLAPGAGDLGKVAGCQTRIILSDCRRLGEIRQSSAGGRSFCSAPATNGA
jgi:hypothetical protein